MATYPTITDATLVPLRAIQLQLIEDPDFLNHDDCPYPTHIRDFLRVFGGVQSEKRGSYSEDELIDDITDLYEELKTITRSVNNPDVKDKIALMKTAGDLLTRMVALKEKAVNMRSMSQFQRAVVEVLETVITPAQRSEFIEKLGKYDVR